jgi:epoxyqueuosine reductase
MKETLRRRARAFGFDDCRFTSAAPPASLDRFERWLAAGQDGEMTYLARSLPKRADPGRVLPGVQTIVVVAAHYAGPGVAPAGSTGVVAAYARHADYHTVLAAPLRELAAAIDVLGGPGTRSLAYVDTGPILERDLAQRAGLGFIGKHTNLIRPRGGNWFLIGEILTTLALAPDAPETNRCGRCTRCLAACPTGAIHAPFELDARRCIAYLTIELRGPIPEPLRPAIGRRIFGCDDCLAACPWNRFAQAGALLGPHARADLSQPDLLELLALDAAAFRQRFGDTPLARAKHAGFQRNVCVALGNCGDPQALPALDRAARTGPPLVAEHARWAMAQIGAHGRAPGSR